VAGQGERPDGETGWFERSTYPKLPVAGTPTPRVEQAPPGHGRRPRMLISLALGLGLTGVAVILFRNQAETKTEKDVNPKSLLAAKAKDPAPGAEAYQELTAGRWHNVLQSPPHQLLWPKNAAIPPYFEPAREELMVSSNQLGLLGLGTTPHPGYVFKIFLRQHKWAGGLGIFFGFHPDTHQGKPCMRYQAIHFDFLNRKDPNQTFMFSRSLCMIYSDEYGDKVFPSHTKAGHAIARPTAREHNFEIEVSPQGLQKVLWGGQALSNLSTPEANKHFKAADYAGQFGIVCAASQGVFREARVLILEKENR